MQHVLLALQYAASS